MAFLIDSKVRLDVGRDDASAVQAAGKEHVDEPSDDRRICLKRLLPRWAVPRETARLARFDLLHIKRVHIISNIVAFCLYSCARTTARNLLLK